jgi:PAS domain S-box-containing protein
MRFLQHSAHGRKHQLPGREGLATRGLHVTSRQQANSTARPSKGEVISCLAAGLLISALVAAAARHLHPIALGLGLMLALSGLGLYLLNWRYRQAAGEPRWRDLPCYITQVGPDLRIIDSNAAFRRDIGDRIGEYCYEAYQNNHGPCPDCPVQATFEDGMVHTREGNLVSGGGTVINVLVTASPVRSTSGKITSVLKMATNISEAIKLRRELEKSRSDFERLFSAVPCFICVQDRHHQIIEANSLYRREFGATYGSRCWEVCKHRTSQCPDCLVDRTFADGKIHSSEEVLTTQDGRRINVIVYTRPVRDESGKIVGVMEVFTDITEVKSLQRQLALMGRAVAGMAHRIKNIVMGLEGGIFVVNTGMETDDKQTTADGWEMVERNVQRVSNIVKDLLFCAKTREPELVDDVSPHEIVAEVCDLYADRMAEEDITIRTELSQPPHRGRFDPEGLHSLLCNLTANAIDACRFDLAEDKDHHTIVLRCRLEAGGTTVLEVEDDGIGIPEELNAKVFEDYFSSKGTEGTGIGLLVVQKVAEEHGGKVTFSSKPGHGTRFTVTIPHQTGDTPVVRQQ